MKIDGCEQILFPLDLVVDDLPSIENSCDQCAAFDEDVRTVMRNWE